MGITDRGPVAQKRLDFGVFLDAEDAAGDEFCVAFFPGRGECVERGGYALSHGYSARRRGSRTRQRPSRRVGGLLAGLFRRAPSSLIANPYLMSAKVRHWSSAAARAVEMLRVLIYKATAPKNGTRLDKNAVSDPPHSVPSMDSAERAAGLQVGLSLLPSPFRWGRCGVVDRLLSGGRGGFGASGMAECWRGDQILRVSFGSLVQGFCHHSKKALSAWTLPGRALTAAVADNNAANIVGS
ncbi:hypothetical protein [Streptomyces sp. NPDC002133]|uniref:hypothetical protein n=1 Tax=Streptomyces sp. NPDC002133 TaxID=3154409 RepID=UPI00331C046C